MSFNWYNPAQIVWFFLSLSLSSTITKSTATAAAVVAIWLLGWKKSTKNTVGNVLNENKWFAQHVVYSAQNTNNNKIKIFIILLSFSLFLVYSFVLCLSCRAAVFASFCSETICSEERTCVAFITSRRKTKDHIKYPYTWWARFFVLYKMYSQTVQYTHNAKSIVRVE